MVGSLRPERPLEWRSLFDDVAEEYDAVRPEYPEEIFRDILEYAGLGADARLLEIGCGTGKATVPFARRGFEIVALEPGGRLADIARRNLAPYAGVEVVDSTFEDWPPEPGGFDLVYAATAFHWVDPSMRLTKSALVLGKGGCLAVWGAEHVAHDDPSDDEFFHEAQAVYARHAPESTDPNWRLRRPDEWPDETDELQRGLFRDAESRRHLWDVTYDTGSYVRMCATHSPKLALPEHSRNALLDGLADLLDRRYGGRVRVRYMSRLRMARRR